jgi:hypothetical protein
MNVQKLSRICQQCWHKISQKTSIITNVQQIAHRSRHYIYIAFNKQSRDNYETLIHLELKFHYIHDIISSECCWGWYSNRANDLTEIHQSYRPSQDGHRILIRFLIRNLTRNFIDAWLDTWLKPYKVLHLCHYRYFLKAISDTYLCLNVILRRGHSLLDTLLEAVKNTSLMAMILHWYNILKILYLKLSSMYTCTYVIDNNEYNESTTTKFN